MKVLLFVALVLGMCAPQALAAPRVGGERFRDAPYAPQMVVVPAGAAVIGSTAEETAREGRALALAAFERPQRTVRFGAPFAVGRFHVTRREFAAFAAETKRPMAGCVVVTDGAWSAGPREAFSYARVGFPQRADEPVVCVNWYDATAYADWLSLKTGARYRLLTEGEWEYSARGGVSAARWWGDDAARLCTRVNGGDRDYAAVMPTDKTANAACGDGYAFTSPVRRFAPNPFGLHDMLGNAWQWTADCFTESPGAPGPDGNCQARSIRGGSWHNGVATLRAATRFSLPPELRSSSLGFRVMRELAPMLTE